MNEPKGICFLGRRSPLIVGLMLLGIAILALASGYSFFILKEYFLGTMLLAFLANIAFWYVIYSRTRYEIYEDEIKARNPLSHKTIKYSELTKVVTARRGFSLYSTDYKNGVLLKYKNKKGKEKGLFLTCKKTGTLGKIIFLKKKKPELKLTDIVSVKKKENTDNVTDDTTK